MDQENIRQHVDLLDEESMRRPIRLPDQIYRVATKSGRFRVERLRRKWFGLWGPLVWKRATLSVYLTYGAALHEKRQLEEEADGWREVNPPVRPTVPPPSPPPFPANRRIREGDRA